MEGLTMPQAGEGWRHYKDRYPNLYEIVGLATHTEDGDPLVIYREYGWSLIQPAPLYARPLNVFLGSVDTADGHKRRFTLERPAPPKEAEKQVSGFAEPEKKFPSMDVWEQKRPY